MRYASDHKAETRKRVLKEAARDIRAKGPDNVGVAAIMARAGLTHGGFYAHFASKEALVAEATGVMFEDSRERAAAIGMGDPRAALRGYVDFYVSAAHRDARDRGCPLPALSGDFARSTSAARTRFARGVAGLTERLAEALGRLGRADAPAEANAMLAQMVGAVALSRALDGAESDAILADTRAALITHYGLEDAA